MNKIFTAIFVIIYSLFLTQKSYAIKIVAFVHENVITDLDVEEFEKILCKMDTRFKCGSQNSKQMALFGMIESELKLEHYKQIDLGDSKKKIEDGFNDYKRQIIKSIKYKDVIPQSFNDYLYSEYIWNIILSSQIDKNVSDEEINNFIKEKKISNTNRNFVRNIILQERMNKISQDTLEELKKFYLVDIKGM